MFVILAMTVKGQSSSALLTNGRGWHYRADIIIGDVYATEFPNAFIYGDTIIDGRLCKKLYASGEYNHDNSLPDIWFEELQKEGQYRSAWYEDGKKVYRIPSHTTIPELMFDFGMHVGDRLPHNENLVYWYDDYITVNGYTNIPGEGTKTEPHTYRRMRFAEGELTENPKLSDWCLVEGIGGNEGILYTEFQTAPQNGCVYVKFENCDQFIENQNGYPVYEGLFGRDSFTMTETNISDELAYRLFVVDCKTWECTSEDPGYQPETCVYAFDGETVINGITYKRMTRDGEYYAALRQEGQKVYAVTGWSEDERLLYDFGLQVGDTYSFFETNATMYLVQTDYIEVNGQQLRRLKFAEDASSEGSDANSGMVECWVEGIGGICGPVLGGWPLMGSYNKMEKCKYQGEEIFEYSNFLNAPVMDIQSVTATNRSNVDAIYDLQGRRLGAVPERGIYIRNGKKYVNK